MVLTRPSSAATASSPPRRLTRFFISLFLPAVVVLLLTWVLIVEHGESTASGVASSKNINNIRSLSKSDSKSRSHSRSPNDSADSKSPPPPPSPPPSPPPPAEENESTDSISISVITPSPLLLNNNAVNGSDTVVILSTVDDLATTTVTIDTAAIYYITLSLSLSESVAPSSNAIVHTMVDGLPFLSLYPVLLSSTTRVSPDVGSIYLHQGQHTVALRLAVNVAVYIYSISLTYHPSLNRRSISQRDYSIHPQSCPREPYALGVPVYTPEQCGTTSDDDPVFSSFNPTRGELLLTPPYSPSTCVIKVVDDTVLRELTRDVSIQELSRLSVNDEVIIVECNNPQPNQKFNKVYNMHVVNRVKDEILDRKHLTTTTDAPNVVLVFMDSVSRSALFSLLTQTMDLLRTIKSNENHPYLIYDFNNFNSLGGGTHGNIPGMMCGRPTGVCYDVNNDKDNDPYRQDSGDKSAASEDHFYHWLWNVMSRSGYVTSYAADECSRDQNSLARLSLNLMSGFGHQLSDKDRGDVHHRSANMANAVFNNYACALLKYKSWDSDWYGLVNKLCIGGKYMSSYVIDYTLQFFNNYKKYLKFSMIAMEGAHESSYHRIRTMDDDITKLLTTIMNSEDTNTVMILMGDHGLGYGDLHLKSAGIRYYEKQPPLMMIYPRQFIERHPSFHDHLLNNQNIITSMYDIYATIDHLRSLTNPEHTYYNPYISDYGGQSLLTPLFANRTCADLRIDPSYCSCTTFETNNNPKEIINKFDYVAVGMAAVNYINSQVLSYLNTICSKQLLSNIQFISKGVGSFSATFDAYNLLYTKPEVYEVSLKKKPVKLLTESECWESKKCSRYDRDIYDGGYFVGPRLEDVIIAHRFNSETTVADGLAQVIITGEIFHVVFVWKSRDKNESIVYKLIDSNNAIHESVTLEVSSGTTSNWKSFLLPLSVTPGKWILTAFSSKFKHFYAEIPFLVIRNPLSVGTFKYRLKTLKVGYKLNKSSRRFEGGEMIVTRETENYIIQEWESVSGNKDDAFVIKLIDPNGQELYSDTVNVHPDTVYNWQSFSFQKSAEPGLWTVQATLNKEIIGESTFTVTATLAEQEKLVNNRLRSLLPQNMNGINDLFSLWELTKPVARLSRYGIYENCVSGHSDINVKYCICDRGDRDGSIVADDG